MRETDHRNRKPRARERERRRRKRSMKEGERKDTDGEEEEREDGEDGGQGDDEVDDGRVLGVFVHHSDYLPIGDQNLLHPNVKVTGTNANPDPLCPNLSAEFFFPLVH